MDKNYVDKRHILNSDPRINNYVQKLGRSAIELNSIKHRAHTYNILILKGTKQSLAIFDLIVLTKIYEA